MWRYTFGGVYVPYIFLNTRWRHTIGGVYVPCIYSHAMWRHTIGGVYVPYDTFTHMPSGVTIGYSDLCYYVHSCRLITVTSLCLLIIAWSFLVRHNTDLKFSMQSVLYLTEKGTERVCGEGWGGVALTFGKRRGDLVVIFYMYFILLSFSVSPSV